MALNLLCLTLKRLGVGNGHVRIQEIEALRIEPRVGQVILIADKSDEGASMLKNEEKGEVEEKMHDLFRRSDSVHLFLGHGLLVRMKFVEPDVGSNSDVAVKCIHAKST